MKLVALALAISFVLAGCSVSGASSMHEATAHMQLLQEAIDKLPPLQRTLVTLYHLEEMGIGEIAEVTGQPEGTVKNYLFRARAKLRATLETKLGVAACRCQPALSASRLPNG